MREPRIKIPAAAGEADYHCSSKTVNGERLFGKVEKKAMRNQLWKVADFCGVQVLTYTILDNHFHVVVRVPKTTPVSDQELLRRYEVLHPRSSKWSIARLEAISALLKKDTPEAHAWRKRQLLLMGDVSQFMKLFKQRFSIWFNTTQERFGPLWCDRFHSELLGPGVLEVATTYVDLNCVRAGIVEDPKDYHFCGYAEAVAGNVTARQGLRAVFGGDDWGAVQAAYRQRLFGVGGKPRDDAAHIPLRKVQQVFAEGGVLPLPALLRHRQKSFAHGGILGTREFVMANAPKVARHREPKPLPRWTADAKFTALRAVRGPIFG